MVVVGVDLPGQEIITEMVVLVGVDVVAELQMEDTAPMDWAAAVVVPLRVYLREVAGQEW